MSVVLTRFVQNCQVRICRQLNVQLSNFSNFSIHDKTKIKNKYEKRAAIEETVFQHAVGGEKRRDHCFAWGCATTGALGKWLDASCVYSKFSYLYKSIEIVVYSSHMHKCWCDF